MTEPNEKTDETLPGLEAQAGPENPQPEEPNLHLAENYLRAGIFSPRALKVFERAIAAEPERSDFEKALSICYLVQAVNEAIQSQADGVSQGGDSIADQRETLESLFAQFPGSSDLTKCLGDVRLLNGDWEGATHLYRLAQSKGYREDAAIVTSGRAAMASETCPGSILLFFGDIALTLGQFRQAVEFFRSALNRSLGDRNTALAMIDRLSGDLTARLASFDERQEMLVELARASIEAGEMDRALSLVSEIDFSRYPRADVVKPIARYLVQEEDYRQAFDYLSKISFDQESKAIVNQITDRLEQRGEIDTAVYLLQFINAHDPVIQEAQKIADDRLESAATRELAELCFRSGRYEAAFQHYTNLLRQGAADVTEFADQLEAAALQTVDPDVEDLVSVGEFFFKRRDWRRAENFLNRVLELKPEHPRVPNLLRSLYDTLLETEPALGRIRIKSGDLYCAQDDYERAIAEYQKVLESPGYELEARRRLATAYGLAGKFDEALEKYRELNLRPSDLDILYQLHESMLEAGKNTAALEAATLICQVDSAYRDIEQRVAQLRKAADQPASDIVRDPKMIGLIGDQAIGRYRYIEQIGSGGMGVVHKVYDLKNQCTVAMKILRESLTSSSKAIDRFFREARIAATLSHPNIVNIFDYNINNIHGRSYISMEYVDGPSLRDIIERQFGKDNELTPDYIAEVLYYAGQLCDALEATHLKGIIHRDIKPDNIMVTSARVVKITDFGIVHIEEATFTPTGALIGTPRYMSPEQVRGGRVDCRSDIYAVGIILYESLVGTPPFISGDIAYQHVNVTPTLPREVNPAIPEDVQSVIMCCLEKDPRKRFQRAREVKQALEDILKKRYPDVLTAMSRHTRTAAGVTTADAPDDLD